MRLIKRLGNFSCRYRADHFGVLGLSGMLSGDGAENLESVLDLAQLGVAGMNGRVRLVYFSF
jgi:hypothetical protein